MAPSLDTCPHLLLAVISKSTIVLYKIRIPLLLLEKQAIPWRCRKHERKLQGLMKLLQNCKTPLPLLKRQSSPISQYSSLIFHVFHPFRANPDFSFRIRYIPDSTSLPPPPKQNAANLKSKPPKPNALSFLKKSSSPAYPHHSTTRSMPTSPAIGATTTPSLRESTSTSHPLPNTKSPKSQAIRLALVHLLAVRPVSAEWIAQKLACSQSDVFTVLRKVGKQYSPDETKWDLTDRTFKELDLWEFKYSDKGDRQLAIDRSISAFDRMRLSPEDQIWQMLFPKKDRGKGRTLSNLNHLHKGPIHQTTTPRIHVQHPEDSVQEATAEHDADSRGRPRSTGIEPVSRSRSHESVRKTKISEKEAQSKRLLSQGPKEATVSSKEKGIDSEAHPAVRRGTKKIAAPKSSEFVNDSDEEDGLEDSLNSRGQSAMPNPRRPSSQQKRPVGSTQSSAPIANGTSSKAGKSAASSQSQSSMSGLSDDKPKVRIPRSKADGAALNKNKDLGGTEAVEENQTPTLSRATSEKKPTTNALRNSSQGSTGMKKTLSRQRNGSSPHKPSPLGSSPPTNASDWDNATHSSSSSTPLLSQAGKSTATPNGIPQTTNEHRRNTSEHSLKRKAGDLDIDIHLHGSSSANGDVDGAPTGRINLKSAKRQKTSEPTPPSSDSGSAPSKYDAVKEASRFKDVLYPKYQEFYIQVQELGDDATKQQLEKLMRMHTRLQEVKKEITEAFHGTHC